MNPPPLPNLPPEPPKKSFAHHAAYFSLRIPLVVGLIIFAQLHVINGATPVSGVERLIVGLVVVSLALVGFGLAIAGFCGIPRYGTEDILGRSIAGLVLNALFLLIFAGALVAVFANAAKSRQFTQSLKATELQIRAQERKSFNPKTGITNVDVAGIEKMRTQLDSGAETLSGDDAKVAKAMSSFLARLESETKGYRSAVQEVDDVHVLNLATLMNEQQIVSRRETVQRFIDANASFANTISNSAAYVRAELTRQQLSPDKLDKAMAGFQSKWSVRGPLMLQIRDCDNRIGQGMLGVLDVLDQNWGKWDYNSDTKVVTFADPAAREAYRQFLSEIGNAGREQLAKQAELLSIPQ